MSYALDRAILTAHGQGDATALARLYQEAAGWFERTGDIDAACYFLTQAYVFALEIGLADAKVIRGQLVAFGREE